MASKKSKEIKTTDLSRNLDELKKQVFEIKLAKSISGTYDKKKLKEIKGQIKALYSKGN